MNIRNMHVHKMHCLHVKDGYISSVTEDTWSLQSLILSKILALKQVELRSVGKDINLPLEKMRFLDLFKCHQ